MAKVILVYDPEKKNSKVVTEGVLVKDIRKSISEIGAKKVKVKLVKEFAEDFMNDHNGNTTQLGAYESTINKAAESLARFVSLTPYQYYNQNQ